MTASALDRLCARVGVLPGYTAFSGDWTETDAAARRIVLEGLGVLAPGQSEARALATLERRERERLMPPVVLQRHRGPAARVAFGRRPQGGATWRLVAEDGSVHDGKATGDGIVLPPGLPLGIHELAVEEAGDSSKAAVIVAPGRCYLPDLPRSWLVTTQVYGLRRAGDWGIGDLSSLGEAVEGAAGLGAAGVGINPVHALFPADPTAASPYAPSSRRFLNVMAIDVEAAPGWAEAEPELREALAPLLARARRARLVDYEAIAAAKLTALRRLFDLFVARGEAGEPDLADFRRFVAKGGRALRLHATFDAIHAEMARRGRAGRRWPDWPTGFSAPGREGVREFVHGQRATVRFHKWLQWLASRQLAAVAGRAEAAGAGVGLMTDFAVGVDPGGSEPWADRRTFATALTIGAPPDPLSALGQSWGLVPYHPVALREAGYRPLAAALRASMAPAGAIRIDHAIGVMRLWCVPRGEPGTKGAYLAMPTDELLAVIALESARSRCMVIGEDLGTVPQGLRPRLRRAGVLGYRVLPFEREKDGAFRSPAAYPPLSVAVAGTHDMPTVEGFWRGHDIGWRRRIGHLAGRGEATRERKQRELDRERLLAALEAAGLPIDDAPGGGAPRLAIHRLLAGAGSLLVLVQIEDLIGEIEQVNMPGTVAEHPNWRRRHSRRLSDILADPGVRALAAAIGEARRQVARS